MISLLIILVLAFGVLTSPINDETSTEQLHVEGRGILYVYAPTLLMA